MPWSTTRRRRCSPSPARARWAIAQLKKLRAKNYPEWHWIAVDPNLASLRELPSWKALQSS